MEKKILLGGVLFLAANLAMAQAPKNNLTPRGISPQDLKLGLKPFHRDGQFQKAPLKLSGEVLPEADALAREVTIVYSDMPQARFPENQAKLPVAKSDGKVQHHLLTKKYKVLPVPKNSGFEMESGAVE